MEAYENTLEDIMNTSGISPGFSKDFPRIILANDRVSGKNDHLGEIDMERASYLLSVDDMLEEMLSGRLVTHGYF
jgi:hypothetical protein